jgi:hypothetical protein
MASNIIDVNSGGVNYTSLPRAYVDSNTDVPTDELLAYSATAGGIEEVKVITKGLADSTSTVTFRSHDPSSPLHRATGTVTYGALVDHGGSGSSLKSNVSDGESIVQDLDYYQWWSYKVRVSEDPNKWRGQLNKFAHPAGMRVFTDFTIDSTSISEHDESTTVTNA